jgi:hypothetical protein
VLLQASDTAGALTLGAGEGDVQKELERCFAGPQLEEFSRFVAGRSVQPSSQVTYRRGVTLWRGYLSQVAPERRPDELLRDLRDMRVKALHILALAMYLYREKKWRGLQITAHFAAIALFLAANVENEGLMDHSISLRGESGGDTAEDRHGDHADDLPDDRLRAGRKLRGGGLGDGQGA